jgi:hypothetical protein
MVFVHNSVICKLHCTELDFSDLNKVRFDTATHGDTAW